MLGRRKRVVVQAPVIEPGATRRLVHVGDDSRELVALPSPLREELVWRQPHALRPVFWLESSKGAHLMLEVPFFLMGTPRVCRVESLADAWTIALDWGWGRRKYAIRDTEEQTLLRFEPGFFTAGRVVPQEGDALDWKPTWRSHELRTQGGAPLIAFQRVFRLFRAESSVTVTEDAAARHDLLPLLALLWLAHIDHRRHAH